ncbi:predicted protein [Plenodomus lingam JN3]|uniref:Predicted protein n=1 Tax=Leptosphaeria maculans (strain JN3 / isolate v23.1.3 / race Av1-4-5-6-7-8) TaxID=985895 RepID=E5AEP6_LEPMJ|nr:predicted protein [Plenodomus lingam JN3]CBY01685.1 predicted protein [Plenodomus lingam JN3]
MRTGTCLLFVLSGLSHSAKDACSIYDTPHKPSDLGKPCPTFRPTGLHKTRALCGTMGWVDFGLGYGQRLIEATNPNKGKGGANNKITFTIAYVTPEDPAGRFMVISDVAVDVPCQPMFPARAKLHGVSYFLQKN